MNALFILFGLAWLMVLIATPWRYRTPGLEGETTTPGKLPVVSPGTSTVDDGLSTCDHGTPQPNCRRFLARVVEGAAAQAAVRFAVWLLDSGVINAVCEALYQFLRALVGG